MPLELSLPDQPFPPRLRRRLELQSPLVDGILVPHTAIAAGADGKEVIQRGLATLALGDVVTTLIVKDGNAVATPGDSTPSFKATPHP